MPPFRSAVCRAVLLVAIAVLPLAGCVSGAEEQDEPGRAAAAADPDAARRASELEPPPRLSPRDRSRAARLTRDGRARLARKPAPDLAGAGRALVEAARLGDAEAQFLLSQNELLRADGERDVRAALVWLTRAAVRGNAAAQFQLAEDYANGRRTRREPSWADVWYERAARQGHRDAALALGLRRAAGHGLDVDDLEAYRWLTIAVRAGARQVEGDRTEAAKRLAPEERGALDAEIAAWHPVMGETSPDVAMIRFVQAELVANGFDAGPADGRLGARTHRALTAFRRVQGEANPGDDITPAVVIALRDAAAARPPR